MLRGARLMHGVRRTHARGQHAGGKPGRLRLPRHFRRQMHVRQRGTNQKLQKTFETLVFIFLKNYVFKLMFRGAGDTNPYIASSAVRRSGPTLAIELIGERASVSIVVQHVTSQSRSQCLRGHGRCCLPIDAPLSSRPLLAQAQSHQFNMPFQLAHPTHVPETDVPDNAEVQHMSSWLLTLLCYPSPNPTSSYCPLL